MDDRVALRALVDAYALAVDLRDTARYSALWIDGATLEVHADGADRPPTGIRRAPDDMPSVIEHVRRYAHTHHEISAQSAMVVGDEAVGEVSGRAHHVTTDDGTSSATDRVLTVRYADRYVRHEGAWRFAHRRLDVLWIEERRVQLPD